MSYIEIPGWEKFQHYKRERPTWIKVYTQLLDDPAFLNLTGEQRSLLLGLWLLNAKSARNLPEGTSKLSSRLGQRVTKPMLEALNHAGFIRLTSIDPLEVPLQSLYSTKTEEERGTTESTDVLSSVPRAPARKSATTTTAILREPDPLWDMLTELVGPVTNELERGRRNRALKLLRESGATAAELRRRATLWPQVFREACLTEMGLAANWRHLEQAGPRVGPVRLAARDPEPEPSPEERALEAEQRREAAAGLRAWMDNQERTA